MDTQHVARSTRGGAVVNLTLALCVIRYRMIVAIQVL